MSVSLPQSANTSPRKRSHDGALIRSPSSSSVTDQSRETSNEMAGSSSPPHVSRMSRNRQQSPASSVGSSSLSDLSRASGHSAPSATVSAKKRKLTLAEKEADRALKKQEKDMRERQKLEQKLRKEEEKRTRDEEKRRKEEEKEAMRRGRDLEKAEKQKAKDAEKHAKEEEKRKKEDEQKKKERSQMRIAAFFGKPATITTSPTGTPEELPNSTLSRRSSIASVEDSGLQGSLTKSPDPLKQAHSEYGRTFLPFFLQAHTDLAPFNRFAHGPATLQSDQELIDAGTRNAGESVEDLSLNSKTIEIPRPTFRGRRRVPRRPVPLREIVNQMHGNPSAPIDLTGDKDLNPPRELLRHISVKVLSFREDVRPPYQGTYTRAVSLKSAVKLSKNPFLRALPETNYDYDSEAEWEPPAEGDDDVDVLDDESESEDDAEDMEGFLDDEDDLGKRRMLVGDMVPVCSGLCWEGRNGYQVEKNNSEMKELHMDVLKGDHCFPIDPYSTEYWPKPAAAALPVNESHLSSNTSNFMPPPRMPLYAVNQTHTIMNSNSTVPHGNTETSYGNSTPFGIVAKTTAPQRGRPADQSRQLKMISSDLLAAFKQAVAGSDSTKAGLIEILKKQFPKVSKDIIRDTLSCVAIRQGVKEVDKRWVLVTPL